MSASGAHAAPVSQVMADFGVTRRGLGDAEARARLQRLGPNRLREAHSASVMEILIRQLRSVIIGLLLAASILSFALGDSLEGGAIAAAALLTIALGFITELRAVRSMEALRQLGAVRARVRRAGVERNVSAEELVPGDVVVFEGGDRITADVRVVEASKLQADESALTGESIPVGKSIDSVPENTPLADRKNMLYKGATVTRGAGCGVVVGTGMDTELGRIAALVDTASDESTPLEQRLAALGHKLLWFTLAIAAITATAGVVGGRPVLLMVETGIALAVAAIPEGLPVVATIALARGMYRLAARHALINRLSAVETLGATSVIVCDKTGTLTENHLSVVDIDAPDDLRGVALEIATLCNNASLAGDAPSGDPLEIALLRAAADSGVDRTALARAYPRLREEAFDPATKMMATVHPAPDGVRVVVKGAPEAVLDACTSRAVAGGTQPLDAAARAAITSNSESRARTGLRMLALAQKTAADADTPAYDQLSFVALVALADPPRREVTTPLAACRRAGIRVIMATGDQPATAESIAKQVGLTDDGSVRVVRGDQLGSVDRLPEATRRELLAANVFARVTPEQKLDIIDLFQHDGNVVAMTGDGVNDAPALRKAEIGIAMGKRGTDVAREAAAMVLVDDSFDSIVLAVEQGRAIFENIRRFVVYLLSCNLSELLVVTGAVLLDAPLPLLPLQILFLNLVTDVFPALALGFGEGDPGAMSQPPRGVHEAIVTRRHWMVIGGYAALITAAVLGAMALAFHFNATNAQATTVSFLTLGFAQLFHVFNMRGRGSHVLRNDIVRSPWVWGAIGLCVALLVVGALFAPLARILGAVTIGGRLWFVVAIMSMLPLLVGQLFAGHTPLERRKS